MMEKPDKTVMRWIRGDILAATAYQPTTPDCRVKLDAMESPYGFDDAFKQRWLAKLGACEINRYPAGQRRLRERLAHYFDLPSSCDLIMGNGSDELLQIVALSVASRDRRLLCVTPDFSMYPVIARNCGLGYIGVPLGEGFSLDLDAVLAAIEEHRPAMIWLSCPNNPTGRLWDERQLDAIIAAAPGIVLIDEAYAPFSPCHRLGSLADCANLLIVRTFSKVGLAGLRFGALLGRAELIAEFDKLRLPYNTGVLTGAGVEFALDNMRCFDDRVALIRNERGRLYGVLREMAGVKPVESHANFILFELADAAGVHRALYDGGILVKQFGDDPVLRRYLRVTVGTPDENDAFAAALRALV